MKKVLVIRLSSIGDIVLTSPVLRCIKLQLQLQIHFLTKKSFACIPQSNPYVDKVITYDPKKQSLKELIPALQAAKYTLIVDLHNNFRTAYIKQKLNIKTLVFDKITRQKFWMTQFKINHLPDLHIVDRYLQTVEAIHVKNDGKGLDYFIPIHEHIVVQNIDQRLQAGRFLVFVIGAAHATKRLPAAKIKDICQQLQPSLVVLIGDQSDRVTAAAVATAGPHIIDASGQFNLHQSASIVSQAQLIISHDTGFMHIAAALQRPVVSIWGNTIPDFGMYPYYGADSSKNYQIVQNQTLSCRPCSKIGYPECPKGHFKCMQDIPNEKIIAQIKTLLQ